MAYTQEQREKIIADVCNAMSKDGVSFRQACTQINFPASTVMLWIDQNDDFSEQYARARGALIDGIADEILDIADCSANDTVETDDGFEKTNTEVIQRSRLRVDSRKWLLSKLMPKKFGDKVISENHNINENRAVLTDIDKADIARLAKQLDDEY